MAEYSYNLGHVLASFSRGHGLKGTGESAHPLPTSDLTTGSSLSLQLPPFLHDKPVRASRWWRIQSALFLTSPRQHFRVLVLFLLAVCLALVLYPREAHPPTILATPPNCTCATAILRVGNNGASTITPAYTAMIIETRFTPALEFAIRHMACSLPNDWVVMLVATLDMRGALRDVFSGMLASGKLIVWELSSETQEMHRLCPLEGSRGWCESTSSGPAWKLQGRPSSHAQWPSGWPAFSNAILMSESLYRAIPTDYFIMFQTDGLLCRALEAEDIRALTAYDYIGAPWRWDPMGTYFFSWLVIPSTRSSAGGNGGFSFRRRSLLLRIIQEEKAGRGFFERLGVGMDGGDYEDLFFAKRVQSYGGKLPSHDIAASFAVESVFNSQPLGYHKPWMYLSETELRALTKHCPVIAESLLWSNTTELSACKNPLVKIFKE